MMTHDLKEVALALVADGKGILAADETPHTLTNASTLSASSRPRRAGAPT